MSNINLIPDFRFPEFKGDWTLEELEQCLDYLQPTPFLVDSTDYNDKYETPVLTAGKSFILGYTNEKEGVFNENLPVIIFDDFTTASQFVDFPFKTKSSAMKILLAKNGNNIKFVFESMQTLNYEVGVHKRHWISVFSKLSIAIPKEPQEQQKIASCLSSLDELLAAHNDKLDALKDQKKGLMQNLFPQEGDTVPKVRFSEFEGDGEWVSETLIKLARFRRGSFPQPYGLAKWYDEENGMPFIQVYDVDDNFRLKSTTKRKISSLAGEQSVFIEKGTVIITIQGSIGRVAITQYDAYIDRTLLIFQKFYSDIDKRFFAYVLFLLFEIEKQKAPGGIIKTITKEVLSDFLIKMPSKEEQQKIASCLSALDELITSQTEKIEQLQQHKKGMMQGLFPKIER